MVTNPAHRDTGQTWISECPRRSVTSLPEGSHEVPPRDSEVGDPFRPGAIDNAGSVGVNNNPDLSSRSGHIAGSVQGLAAGDAARRELDEGQIIEIVRAEVTNRNTAAEEYEELGRIDEADRLRSECDVLLRLLTNEIAG